MDETLLGEILATAEVMGVPLSKPALSLIADDLEGYPATGVRQALRRLRQEAGKFTIGEIIKRIPGMWPTSEIAWASAPKSEAQTFITTKEALGAWDIARELDQVPARMAFREAYDENVAQARSRGEHPVWIVSLGHDVDLREQAVLTAVLNGLLPPAKASVYLPHIPTEDIARFANGQISAQALIEKHQSTVESLAQLMAPVDVQEKLATLESNREHIKGIMGVLGTGTPEDDKPKRKTLSQIDSLKRLHGK